MLRDIDLDLLHGELLEALLAGQDAQGIVNCAHAIVGMPIIAFDVEFHVIAFAFERPFYYAPWEEIAEGQGTAQFVEYLPNQERIFRHGRSLLFDHADKPHIWFREAACAIKLDGRLIGYVGTIIEDVDPQTILQANDLLADVLSYHYAHTQKAQQAEELGETELLSLLFADTPAQQITEKIGQRYAPAYVFVVIESVRHSIADLQFIRGTFCRELNHVLGRVGDNGHLRMLFWRQSGSDLYWIAGALENIGHSLGIRCGVSDLFDKPEDFFTYRTQALETLRAGRRLVPKKQVHLFTESISLLICDAALDQLGPSALIPPELKRLASIDGADAKRYIETLESILHNRVGIAKTAKVFGIHSNTLKHRLLKMQDCMGVDLKDPRVQFRLQLGLEMMRLQRPDGSWGGERP